MKVHGGLSLNDATLIRDDNSSFDAEQLCDQLPQLQGAESESTDLTCPSLGSLVRVLQLAKVADELVPLPVFDRNLWIDRFCRFCSLCDLLEDRGVCSCNLLAKTLS
jgi:hypothetical protein